MLEPARLQQIKTELTSATPTQREEVRKLLETITTTTPAPFAAYETQGSRFYARVRRAMHFLRGVELPPFERLKRINPKAISQLAESAAQFDTFMVQEFHGCTKQELDAVSGIVVDAAVRMQGDSASLYTVTAALGVPTQVVDDQFPGYRSGGELRNSLIAAVHGGEEKS